MLTIRSVLKLVVPISELVAKGFTFIIILLLANELTAEEFGSYNYIVSIVMILSVFLDAGINNYAFDRSLKNDTKELSKLFVIKVELSAVICLVSLVVFWFSLRTSFVELFLYTNYIAITSLLFLIKFIARGQSITKVDLLTILIDPVLKLVGIALLFLVDLLVLFNVFIVYLISGFASISYVFFFAKGTLRLSLHKLFGPRAIFELLKKSKYFIFYYLVMVLIQRLDIIYIEKYFGYSQLGLYSSAFNILLIIQLLCRSTITSRLASLFHSKARKYRDFVLALGFSILIIGSIYILSPYIFEALFPPEHKESYKYLQLLIISIPFYVINLIFVYYNNFSDRSIFNGIVFSISFLIKVGLLSSLEFTSIRIFIFQYVGVEVISSTLFLFFYFKNKIRVT